MRDYLDIGPTPCDEPCEQLGPNYDPAKARAECRAFINQLRRIFGEPPDGARFAVRSNPHDFGTYLSVAVLFNDDEPDQVEFALNCENNTPAEWDAEAREELARALGKVRQRQ